MDRRFDDGREYPVRALITGIAGFGGGYLAEHLFDEGWEVLGLDHPVALESRLGSVSSKLEVLPCDLTDLGRGQIESFLAGRNLDAVYHLAAVASVHLSWGSVQKTVTVNSIGTINLIEELQHIPDRPSLLLVGSADEYGAVPPRRQPLRESTPCEPRSPYALSKVWQETLGSFYARLDDWPIFLTRTFNHTGPRQSPDFVCSDFARQIAFIEAGRREPVLRVGNLQAARDFLDVRDVVRAYRLLIDKGRPGVPYNVCSGKAWKIADLLKILIGLSRAKIEVQKDPARSRRADIPLLLGDPGKLRRATGWRPRYAIEEMLADLLEYWRATVRALPPDSP